MTKEQIEILKNWQPTQWPNRAYKWAQFSFPMKEPNWYREGMTEEQIKRRNRQGKAYRLFYHGTKSSVVGYNKLVAAHKKEYWAFCEEHKLPLTAYDRSL